MHVGSIAHHHETGITGPSRVQHDLDLQNLPGLSAELRLTNTVFSDDPVVQDPRSVAGGFILARCRTICMDNTARRQYQLIQRGQSLVHIKKLVEIFSE
jgi:hypothetical protein